VLNLPNIMKSASIHAMSRAGRLYVQQQLSRDKSSRENRDVYYNLVWAYYYWTNVQ